MPSSRKHCRLANGIGTFADLRKYLDDIVAEAEPFSGKPPVTLLQLPHIDYQRGRETYGAAGALLKAMEPPDVVYIFGVDHHGGKETLFHLTQRNYVTVLGEAHVCRESVAAVKRRMGSIVVGNEWLHDIEWTIENPLVLLQACLEPMPRIVPVIVGNARAMFRPHCPWNVATETFLSTVAASVKSHIRSGRRVLLVAGVDLSHCGTMFNGSFYVDEAAVSMIERTDRGYLERLLAGRVEDAESFVGDNCTFIDAIAPMGVAMRVAQMVEPIRESGLLKYVQSISPHENRLVSHASAYWL
jgi:AmmeMemoRadiSam system protein B